jgi:hypothetical protein
VTKVLRSLGLDADDLPEKEKAIRDKLRTKIRSEFIPQAEVAGLPGKIPGLGPLDEESVGWALAIPWAGLSIIAEKIVRGCEYKLKARLIEPPYGIRTFVSESDVVAEPYALAAAVFDFGPGCKIRRVFTTEDPKRVLYWISIWGTLQFRVRIDLEAELLKAEPMFRRCEGILPPENRGMLISAYLRNVNQQVPNSGMASLP